jgi:hypothetical protein
MVPDGSHDIHGGDHPEKSAGRINDDRKSSLSAAEKPCRALELVIGPH